MYFPVIFQIKIVANWLATIQAERALRIEVAFVLEGRPWFLKEFRRYFYEAELAGVAGAVLNQAVV